jgi:aspartyl-tRNA(Asn)/glutamyl-tRNA(Gln) amidotransferase subunit B
MTATSETTAVTAPDGAASSGATWETVIGLEVHAELHTRTKLFSPALNQFGAEPNTNIDPVSLGLPGSLPVLNEKAVELAIRVGLALHCDVRSSVFARKNYFYPDMPKDFQISQYDLPIDSNGWLELPDGSRVGITRAHLEEDTGKSSHQGASGRIHGADYSLVDYNRAGVPLLEIVSEPDIRSAEQARAYVEELRSILVAIGASDGKLEEGSLRVDANVSVRRPGGPLGTRCEIKNVNSLRSLGRAIDYEVARQIELIEAGERVRQQTRHWDEVGGLTRPGRDKENSDDYRYFPEPDLVPVEPDLAWIDAIRAGLPPLPADRRERLAAAAGVERTDPAVAVAVGRGLDELALGALQHGADAARVLTHIEHNLAVDGAELLQPAPFAQLVKMEVSGELTATQTKVVLAELVAAGGEADPAGIAHARGFEAMAEDAAGALVDQLIAENPGEWQRLRDGETKLTGFFVGKAMKATGGKADGKAVTALLRQRAAAA